MGNSFEDKMYKNLTCQNISTMKLENAKDMNVGINNLDTDGSNEIITKYEDCIVSQK